jgi:ATP-dependent DNA helicase DinG
MGGVRPSAPIDGVDIAQDLRSKVLPGDDASSRRKSWVFTSATLGHDADLQWFLASHGLDGAQVLQVQSPFDYARQASLYIPADFPKPSDPSHSAQVAHLAAEGARILGGRTLVLTTTLRAMRTIGKLLREWIPASYGIDVLVQGEGAKRDLMERFNQSNVSGKPGCVLVASASFWEGFDVPGDALQLVLIDKIPFAPPDDPLVEARCQVLAAQGKNAFAHYQLPMAAVALQEGVGRLIRNESDRGVMVLCDVRLQQMGYGRKLLAGLPPMRRLEHALDFRQALEALTTSSTTDLNLSSPPW